MVPIVTLDDTFEVIPFLRALLSLLEYSSCFRVLLCLWIQVQSLMDLMADHVSFVNLEFNSSYRIRLVDSSHCSTLFLR